MISWKAWQPKAVRSKNPGLMVIGRWFRFMPALNYLQVSRTTYGSPGKSPLKNGFKPALLPSPRGGHWPDTRPILTGNAEAMAMRTRFLNQAENCSPKDLPKRLQC